ncbi:tetratricopeptide repeat protein [Pseudonocardia abyssalis]|uniref:Tetratricopeptide repeat protein n=1 Tax=Pseudonocardia abyssalis TaxID=2792008 RepID=A0ABS6ULX9_9PSEU|nr:tetratricopeptide repeat protein [Pseudonocardia abyssalis]MBW0114111.1 tetratricopeptide repeat protein [Pseudonocardia abyssalis]MBW0133249.1 tetratricopeptide repeat protein [Pseudonocardia abyssalis]
MSTRELQLRQLADQAVRDIVELDEQVAAGEITDADAQPLRRRYESAAARALHALDAAAPDPDAGGPAPPRPPRLRAWTLGYAIAGVVAVLVAVVLLPASVIDRPAGGFVTGNEIGQDAATGAAPPLDPNAPVTDEQMEQVVAANPDVVGMRLALADRYVAQGDYAKAMGHYLDGLRREPGNASGLARLGWLLFQIDQPQDALESVDQALAIDPNLDEALWYRANIQLDGLNDPVGALTTLLVLDNRPLDAALAAQVDELTAQAEQRAAGTG